MSGDLVMSNRDLTPRQPTNWERLLFKIGILHLTHPHLVFMTPRDPQAAVEKSQSEQAAMPNEAKT